VELYIPLYRRWGPGTYILIVSSNADGRVYTESSLGTDSPFAASLGFSSKWPVLALEDFETSLDGIRCSDAGIEISFKSCRYCDEARKSWEDLKSFLIITSHPGCNHNGERSPYLYDFYFILAQFHLGHLPKFLC
jgi:hypothetical protein